MILRLEHNNFVSVFCSLYNNNYTNEIFPLVLSPTKINVTGKGEKYRYSGIRPSLRSSHFTPYQVIVLYTILLQSVPE